MDFSGGIVIPIDGSGGGFISPVGNMERLGARSRPDKILIFRNFSENETAGPLFKGSRGIKPNILTVMRLWVGLMIISNDNPRYPPSTQPTPSNREKIYANFRKD
jgi:hypothetical protein